MSEKTVPSDDLAVCCFVCDLNKCKGACCVEGDMGAPLDVSELTDLKDAYEAYKPYLSVESIREIETQGFYVRDKDDGAFKTPTIDGKECVYAFYDNEGILKCAIERAQRDGKTDFQKPISCHLYPIRIAKYDDHEELTYDRWDICNPACDLGEELNVPIYKFVKKALIRKYGIRWYEDYQYRLEKASNQPRSQQ